MSVSVKTNPKTAGEKDSQAGKMTTEVKPYVDEKNAHWNPITLNNYEFYNAYKEHEFVKSVYGKDEDECKNEVVIDLTLSDKLNEKGGTHVCSFCEKEGSDVSVIVTDYGCYYDHAECCTECMAIDLNGDSADLHKAVSVRLGADIRTHKITGEKVFVSCGFDEV